MGRTIIHTYNCFVDAAAYWAIVALDFLWLGRVLAARFRTEKETYGCVSNCAHFFFERLWRRQILPGNLLLNVHVRPCQYPREICSMPRSLQGCLVHLVVVRSIAAYIHFYMICQCGSKECVDTYLIEFPPMGMARPPRSLAFCFLVDTIESLSDFLFFGCDSAMARSSRGLEGAVGRVAICGSVPPELGAVMHEYISTWMYRACVHTLVACR
jgi:hypothetical protein